MTIYGPDISSYEAGLDLSRLADALFVIAKASEGTYYTDAAYQAWRRQATSMGRLFAWYHFLSTEDAAAQVAHTKACVGDPGLPGMLDFEPTSKMKPTLAQAYAYLDEAKATGLRVPLVYLPRWYWQELGSPSLSGLAQRGARVVASAYPGGSGRAPALYPGDQASGWNSYGGQTPLLYQFTNQASDGGKTMDYNAFRGTEAQLRAYLGTAAPTMTGVTTVTTIPPTIAHHFPGMDLSADFPPNADVDPGTAAVWADARAEAAYRQAATNTGLLSQLLATVKQQALDPTVLAAAIVAKLPALATADPAAIAAATVAALEEHGITGVDEQALAGEIVTEIAARLAKGGS